MEILKARIVNKIMQEIDNLESVSVKNLEEDETISAYYLYADYFVYKAKSKNNYYFHSMENGDIDLISKEELVKIVSDNWDKIKKEQEI